MKRQLPLFAFFLSLFTLMFCFATKAQPPQYYNGTAGTSSNSFPLNSTTSNKVQWIYDPGMFKSNGATGTPAPAGLITKVYFRLGTANATNTYSNYRISLGQNVGTITAWPNTTFTTGLTQCFFQPSFQMTGAAASQWYGITLQTPFLYDPTQSLVFELQVSAGTGNTVLQVTTNGTRRKWGLYTATTGSSGTGLVDFGFDVLASANNLAGQAILSPTNLNQYCSYTPVNVKALIKNSGSAAQSNFQVGAYYEDGGLISGNLSAVYLGTLAPFASDSISLGALSLPPGNYNLVAYTLLATDTLKANDTTPTVNFTLLPAVPSPLVHSDTVCAGMNASVFIDPKPNTVYNWYSAATGGTVVNVGNGLNFSPLGQDTTMYVSGTTNGCESPRIPITAAIGPPPVVNLGMDTSFCESLPLILNAGNPGGKYMWSTGDSTQTITVTNQSGNYWVVVDKYCTNSDSVLVSIDPLPYASGISYVRTGNAYHFSVINVQFVDDFLWIFGDGYTSTLPNPVHTYGSGIDVDLLVRLVVANHCGSDTVFRKLPTSIGNLNQADYSVAVYPNPANDFLNIDVEGALIEDIYMVNNVGSIVLKQSVSKANSHRVDFASLPAGNYILRVNSTKGSINKPVVILKQ